MIKKLAAKLHKSTKLRVDFKFTVNDEHLEYQLAVRFSLLLLFLLSVHDRGTIAYFFLASSS